MIGEAYEFLFAQSFTSFAALFAFMIIFEIPRYLATFVAAALFERPKPTCNAGRKLEDHSGDRRPQRG